jgi:uncharacterized membrane protein (DUF373 family)
MSTSSSTGAPGNVAPLVEEPPTRRALERAHRPLVVLDALEDVVHYVVATLLLAIAGILLYRTVEHLIDSRDQFALQVINGINDLLLVIILMELLRTVVGHLETRDFQLRPFLIVGIITAVRHILGVGARLTLAGEVTDGQFRRDQIELGVSAGVVLALAVSYFLASRGSTGEEFHRDLVR